ncbi:hypothetical protein N3K66_006173 [Trichothecium roseum]|uniref:Uncharacterized protein n=1 Tax=Trichothecium roseum TaxID=47278 RepID=A0ACC0V1M1_9HYPO|nr:hypothetical protein N3K66_006173 [Trichothecium roseum]
MANAKTGVKLRSSNNNNTNDHASPAASPHTDGGKKEAAKPLVRLLSWDDLPPWRRDNSFILTGYRPHVATVANVFSSLLHLHNESVNIWSHLLGGLTSVLFASSLFLLTHHVVLPRYPSASRADAAVFAAFLGGAAACMGMSAAFHALLSHSRAAARWGNKLDYTGIVALIVGSYVPALYYGFFCEPRLMEVYMSLICLLGLACTTVSWVDRFRTPAWRPYRAAVFVALGLSGVVPVVHGVRLHGYAVLDRRMSVSLVILHGALYIFGAVLYAMRWPERSSPGSYDIWGSSHQIFHVFVILAAGTHLYAMVNAFDHHHTVMGAQCLLD